MSPRSLPGSGSDLKITGTDIRDLGHPIADHHLSAVNQQFILFDYWRILLKRGWVIVCALILSLAGATITTLRTTPLYRAAGDFAGGTLRLDLDATAVRRSRPVQRRASVTP